MDPPRHHDQQSYSYFSSIKGINYCSIHDQEESTRVFKLKVCPRRTPGVCNVRRIQSLEAEDAGISIGLYIHTYRFIGTGDAANGTHLDQEG